LFWGAAYRQRRYKANLIMTEEKKLLLKRVILITLFFIVSIFIYQITWAQNISFSNNMIDNFFHFSKNTIALFIIVLILWYLFLISKKTLHKNIIGFSLIPIVLLFLLSLLYLSAPVFAPSKANIRHYFYEKNGYSYYLVSERYWAFEGSSNLRIYREKPLFLFLKERVSVSEEELAENNINYGQEYQLFFEKYFNQK
jgi:hypothetical protein